MTRLAIIIAAGIASRLIHTGWILFDKYLGDALYAVMVYAIVRLFRLRPSAALIAMGVMTALELFQLTLIPAHMLTSTNALIRLAARLLGTQFSFLDLAAYSVGIAAIEVAERLAEQRQANGGALHQQAPAERLQKSGK